MHLFDARRQATSERTANGTRFEKLKSAALASLVLAGTMPGYAMQAAPPATTQTQPQTTANPAGQPNTQGLPPEPAPNYTEPLFMRPGTRDFAKPRGYWPNPVGPYTPTTALLLIMSLSAFPV